MFDAEKIREDFPVLEREVNGKDLVYLDNTATSQKPRQVMDAISEFYEKHNANIHRGVHALSQEASEMFDKGRENVADFIWCLPEELIFTRGTTESINLVAYSWALHNLKEGDEIIISKMEHHSNIIPWHLISKLTGANVKAVEMGNDFSMSMESLESLISSRTKIVAVTHFSNVLGTVTPAKDICKLARDYDAVSVIDGAQSAPHLPINVKGMGCDFFAFSAHKMLGPTGIGGLYGKVELLEEMPPFNGGGGMIADVSFDHSTYAKPPEKFEAGTPNIAGVAGFSAAVDYLKKVGMENVHEHEKVLNRIVIKRLNGMEKVKLYGPENVDKRGAVYSFNAEGMNPHDVAVLLDQEGIAVRSGHHCAQPLMKELGIEGTARASPYLYNTEEEVKTFLDILEEIVSKL
ncbi:MAG: cysteine desulfurase [Candidatus Micrarchaeota archaeon]|nr:cysteine desulfurase [Candidatus Micrarchaeota archaeon]